MSTKYVLLYTSTENVMSVAPAHFPGHQAHIAAFRDRGLTNIGLFGDPQTEGAMAIFASHEAAEEFATTDPFVTNGVVAKWEIRTWNDMVD